MTPLKSILFSALTLSFLFLAAFSDTDEKSDRATAWEVDRAHSAVNFTINHFFTPVDGAFDDYEAEVYFDPENLSGSHIDVTIPVASVNTRNSNRDDHLRTPDFFDAENYPSIRFVSSEILQDGESNFIARGELTIRDVTKEFDLPFELLGVMDHPMRENTQVAGIVASAELLRNDFGVGTGDWRATAVVGNRVNIQLNLELLAGN
ncbi:MAG: YceI family protein [Balneolaceae bacterium]|nr:YceI family protein [Balneolaceae bacterium]MCH8549710.1 YceI family protein [Balneolaceae bacterium]